MRSRARRDLLGFCKEAKSVPTWQRMELVARAFFARLACMGGYRDLKGANAFLTPPRQTDAGPRQHVLRNGVSRQEGPKPESLLSGSWA